MGCLWGACGVLIQHEMAHHSAKVGDTMRMHRVLVWHEMAHCLARAGGEVSGVLVWPR